LPLFPLLPLLALPDFVAALLLLMVLCIYVYTIFHKKKKQRPKNIIGV
jgi:hypothetical protein